MEEALNSIGLLVLSQLFLDFLESEETAVYPSLPLSEEAVHSLNGINLGVSIRKKSHIVVLFVYAHT